MENAASYQRLLPNEVVRRCGVDMHDTESRAPLCFKAFITVPNIIKRALQDDQLWRIWPKDYGLNYSQKKQKKKRCFK
jgi:hypothetical protein